MLQNAGSVSRLKLWSPTPKQSKNKRNHKKEKANRVKNRIWPSKNSFVPHSIWNEIVIPFPIRLIPKSTTQTSWGLFLPFMERWYISTFDSKLSMSEAEFQHLQVFVLRKSILVYNWRLKKQVDGTSIPGSSKCGKMCACPPVHQQKPTKRALLTKPFSSGWSVCHCWEPSVKPLVIFSFKRFYRLPSRKLAAKTPENGWLEDEIPFGMAYFQGRTVSFREGKCSKLISELSVVWCSKKYGNLQPNRKGDLSYFY